MKRTLSLAIALGLVCFIAISAGATEKKVAAPAAAKTVQGEVVSVDAAAKTVVVKAKPADLTLTVNDKTAIACGKTTKTLADVKAKDKVKAEYKVEGTANVASKIDIEAAPAPAAAPAVKKPVKK